MRVICGVWLQHAGNLRGKLSCRCVAVRCAVVTRCARVACWILALSALLATADLSSFRKAFIDEICHQFGICFFLIPFSLCQCLDDDWVSQDSLCVSFCAWAWFSSRWWAWRSRLLGVLCFHWCEIKGNQFLRFRWLLVLICLGDRRDSHLACGAFGYGLGYRRVLLHDCGLRPRARFCFR